jgi:diguanylate cyclase (GGDEF)-like protein
MKSTLKILHCGKGSPVHPLFRERGVKNNFWSGDCDEILNDWKGYDLVFVKVKDYPKVQSLFEKCLEKIESQTEGKYPVMVAVGDEFTKKDIATFRNSGFFDYFDLSPANNLSERFTFLLDRCEKFCRREKELRRLHAQSETLKSDNKDLKRLTLTDDLTGLHNTRYMKEIFADLFSLVHRYDRPLTVCMLDLDHFKDVNDANDHLIGSTVLKEIGRILKEHTRKSDVRIRYGGDEFVVIMTETPIDSAMRVSERIRKTIEELTMTVRPDYVVKVTASLGVATFDKTRHTEYWELLREADMAMYSAKKMGRNKVCIFGGEVQGYDTSKSSFATVLRQIIDVDTTKKKGLPSELNRYLNMIKKNG